MALVFSVMHYIIFSCFYCFCPFLLLKSGIDKSMEWSTILACPRLMCFFFFFFEQGQTEGTNSSKIVCLMFLCVCV